MQALSAKNGEAEDERRSGGETIARSGIVRAGNAERIIRRHNVHTRM